MIQRPEGCTPKVHTECSDGKSSKISFKCFCPHDCKENIKKWGLRQTQTSCLPKFVNKYFWGSFFPHMFLLLVAIELLFLKLIIHLKNKNEFKFKERCHFHYFMFSLRTRFLEPYKTSRISLLKGKGRAAKFRALLKTNKQKTTKPKT